MRRSTSLGTCRTTRLSSSARRPTGRCSVAIQLATVVTAELGTAVGPSVLRRLAVVKDVVLQLGAGRDRERLGIVPTLPANDVSDHLDAVLRPGDVDRPAGPAPDEVVLDDDV